MVDDSQQTLTKSGPWPADDDETIFEVGDLVDGRYRILRFLARGGAAEVYEAEDQALRHRLAVKALQRDASKARSIERFKREINLARQVTHPNVCRIYEFGSHGDNVLFLTMELLSGETLHERIARRGPLAPAEALPLVRQMAAGLAAAHRAGVVHRDFKCGNVMLVPAAEEEGGHRVAITDFGLAREAVGEDLGPSVTAQDALVGTPAYMAPEQVEGGSITPAVDVYAFGVVLYEMLTGRYPFQGESSLATAILRLRDDPTPPSAHVPDLDAGWENTILRCLERRAENRFASVVDVVAALDAGGSARVRRAAESVDEERPAASMSSPVAVATAAVLAAVVAAGWWIFTTRPPPALDATTAAAPRRSIALLGFQNLSGEPVSQWLSPALSEMLAMEAAAGEDIRVIPGDDVVRTKIELGLEEVDALPPDAVARAGEILGADLVVVGSYLVAGRARERGIRLDLRILRSTDAEILQAMTVRGTEAEVLDLVETAGRELRAALGLAGLSEAEAEAMRASRPADTESAMLYARGLEELRLYDAKEALELLESAARSDPENPLVHAALSSAWAVLGYQVRAREEAALAVELSGGLGQRDKLWVEARHFELTGDRQKAIDLYRRLWDFYPDNGEYGLRLAAAQVAVADGEAALATLGWLRDRSSSTKSDPRIDLAEAEASRSLADYATQQLRAAAAARKARDLGARLLLARARAIEAEAFRDLGETRRAMDAFEEARGIYADANNRSAVANVLTELARIHRYQDRIGEARSQVEEALAIARQIGDQTTLRGALNLLAIISRDQGRLSEALAQHQMELEASREIGEIQPIQIALTGLGVALRDLGNLDGARKSFEEALGLSRESGYQRSVATNVNLIGWVLLHQGEVEEARKRFEEALDINRSTQSPRGRAYYLANLGATELAADRLDRARERHEEALAIRESLGETKNGALSRLALARVAIEEGRTDEAADQARKAVEELRSWDDDTRGYAFTVLASAYLSQSRVSDAETAVDRALELLASSEHRLYRMRAALRSAEVDAALARQEAALRKLREVAAEAAELGFVDVRLEAELVLGLLESETVAPAGAQRLRAVATEASERGFHLIAKKAGGRVLPAISSAAQSLNSTVISRHTAIGFPSRVAGSKVHERTAFTA